MSNRPNKITHLKEITKPSEAIITKENLDLSVLSGLWSSLESVTPEQKFIPCKKNRK